MEDLVFQYFQIYMPTFTMLVRTHYLQFYNKLYGDSGNACTEPRRLSILIHMPMRFVYFGI
jgi:hypothetical protein